MLFFPKSCEVPEQVKQKKQEDHVDNMQCFKNFDTFIFYYHNVKVGYE